MVISNRSIQAELELIVAWHCRTGGASLDLSAHVVTRLRDRRDAAKNFCCCATAMPERLCTVEASGRQLFPDDHPLCAWYRGHVRACGYVRPGEPPLRGPWLEACIRQNLITCGSGKQSAFSKHGTHAVKYAVAHPPSLNHPCTRLTTRRGALHVHDQALGAFLPSSKAMMRNVLIVTLLSF